MQHATLAKKTQSHSGHFRFGDAEIDVAAHTLFHRGTPCAIEPKAFEVLMQLVTHPGDVLTKDQLLDSVWGHRCVTPNVLSRVVAQLRHALHDSAHAPHCIETVPTLGYRFIAPLQEALHSRLDAGAVLEGNGIRDSNLMEEIQRFLAVHEGQEHEFPALRAHLEMLHNLFGDRPSGMVLYELAMHYGMEILAEQNIELPWRSNGKPGAAAGAKNPQTMRRKTS